VYAEDYLAEIEKYNAKQEFWEENGYLPEDEEVKDAA
jgi:hypothetical protein